MKTWILDIASEVVRSRIAGRSDHPMGNDESPNRAPLEPRAFIDGVPALAWSALPDGSPESFNQRFLDYSGLSPDQVYAEWKSMLHRDDVEGLERCTGRHHLYS
jgi:PAS domain-containing protein